LFDLDLVENLATSIQSSRDGGSDAMFTIGGSRVLLISSPRQASTRRKRQYMYTRKNRYKLKTCSKNSLYVSWSYDHSESPNPPLACGIVKVVGT
jgi:hypothetical protein